MTIIERLEAAAEQAVETARQLGITVEPISDGRELVSGGAEALRNYRRSIAFAAAAAVWREELNRAKKEERA